MNKFICRFTGVLQSPRALRWREDDNNNEDHHGSDVSTELSDKQIIGLDARGGNRKRLQSRTIEGARQGKMMHGCYIEPDLDTFESRNGRQRTAMKLLKSEKVSTQWFPVRSRDGWNLAWAVRQFLWLTDRLSRVWYSHSTGILRAETRGLSRIAVTLR